VPTMHVRGVKLTLLPSTNTFRTIDRFSPVSALMLILVATKTKPVNLAIEGICCYNKP
jgi:hypothetical protein